MATGTCKKIISGWGTPVGITFPYTPTKDGFIFGFVVPSTSSTSYVYITEGSDAWSRGTSTGGTAYGITFPARAGKEYKISSSSNVGSNTTYRFIPFE